MKDGTKFTLEGLLDLSVSVNKRRRSIVGRRSFRAANRYDEQVGNLKKQIDLSKEIIKNLAALQKLLNQAKIKYPEGYKFPPESLDQIPQEIKDKLFALHNPNPPEQPIWDRVDGKKVLVLVGVTRWIEN